MEVGVSKLAHPVLSAGALHEFAAFRINVERALRSLEHRRIMPRDGSAKT